MILNFSFHRKSDRHQKASECYRKSLKLNPFLCSSFESLCRLGERVDTSIFCSSSIKSSPQVSEITQPHICVTPYAEQIKDIQSENQAIDNVRSNRIIENILFLFHLFASQ